MSLTISSKPFNRNRIVWFISLAGAEGDSEAGVAGAGGDSGTGVTGARRDSGAGVAGAGVAGAGGDIGAGNVRRGARQSHHTVFMTSTSNISGISI